MTVERNRLDVSPLQDLELKSLVAGVVDSDTPAREELATARSAPRAAKAMKADREGQHRLCGCVDRSVANSPIPERLFVACLAVGSFDPAASGTCVIPRLHATEHPAISCLRGSAIRACTGSQRKRETGPRQPQRGTAAPRPTSAATTAARGWCAPPVGSRSRAACRCSGTGPGASPVAGAAGATSSRVAGPRRAASGRRPASSRARARSTPGGGRPGCPPGFGGYSTQDDHATVTAEFLDENGTRLSALAVGPVTRSDRGDETTLVGRTASGPIPTGTRMVVVTPVATRVAGVSNDG